MENSELLHNFIEGDLGANEEQILFSELAENPALRTELKHFIEFEKAAKSDIAAFVPPVETTTGLFSTLGIAPVAASTAVVTAVKTGIWVKYGSMILTNLLTLLVTGVVSYFVFTSILDNKQYSAKNDSVQSVGQSSPQSSLKTNEVPIVSNIQEKSNSKRIIVKRNVTTNTAERENELGQNVLQKSNTQESNDTEEINNVEDIASLNNLVTTSQFQLNSNLLSNYRNLNPKFNGVNLSDFPIHFNFFEKNDFSLMMSGSQYWSLLKETVDRSSSPIFQDGNIVIYYHFNDKFSIGIDLRQEFFFQSFTGFDSNDKKYLYEQNTNYTSYGLVGKLKFFETKYLIPYGQIYLGGNKAGQIGRAMLGLEITPSREYSFVLGMEGSALLYQHKASNFLSSKIGAYYGVMFHF